MGPDNLQSIFDQIGFIDRKVDREIYYALPEPLSSKVRYPVRSKTEELSVAKKETHQQIVGLYKGFAPEYLETLNSTQLLFLLEKFESNAPCDEKGEAALFDRYKVLAAEEVLRANWSNSDPEGKLLILVDSSGIQRFIYNIVSKGARRSA